MIGICVVIYLMMTNHVDFCATRTLLPAKIMRRVNDEWHYDGSRFT